jgi:hypothetical protein
MQQDTSKTEGHFSRIDICMHYMQQDTSKTEKLFKDRYLYALATSLLQALVSVFMRAGILITHKHS